MVAELWGKVCQWLN